MAGILSRAPILYRATYFKNIIFSPIAQVVRVKNYGHFTPNTSDAILEKRLKLKDNISDDYRIIYREHKTIIGLVNISYYSGWLFLFFGISIMTYTLITDPTLSRPFPLNEEEFIEELKNDPSNTLQPPSKFSRIVLMISGLVLPISLIFVSRTMPFRIYHSPSQKLFQGVFVSNILLRKEIEIFSEGSAVPMVKLQRFMADALFKINGRIVLLDRECFSVQAIREKMIYRVK